VVLTEYFEAVEKSI